VFASDINVNLEKHMTIDKELLKIISSINDLDELNRFFNDIFTPAELDDISLRWKLLKDLHKGMTQRKIAEKYGISLCKITRGSKVLKDKASVVLKVLNLLK
jgi:TrpR family trp operon transcriptional repressor